MIGGVSSSSEAEWDRTEFDTSVDTSWVGIEASTVRLPVTDPVNADSVCLAISGTVIVGRGDAEPASTIRVRRGVVGGVMFDDTEFAPRANFAQRGLAVDCS